MLNSSSKIRSKSSDEAIEKIKVDYAKIEERFQEYMTKRSMKNGLEVLDDRLEAALLLDIFLDEVQCFRADGAANDSLEPAHEYSPVETRSALESRATQIVDDL